MIKQTKNTAFIKQHHEEKLSNLFFVIGLTEGVGDASGRRYGHWL